MATEYDKSMNTTFGSFSKTKERKKANRRMAGNATEDSKQSKEAKAAPNKPKKGSKRKARRL